MGVDPWGLFKVNGKLNTNGTVLKVNGIRAFRKDIDIGGEDKYGHWWFEINGSESYGWWPKYPVGLWGTLTSVDGELNGQTSFGGSSTSDPHQGDRTQGVNEYYIYSAISKKRLISALRNYARSYSGSWSWPFGQNCHSFQEGFIEKYNLKLQKK